MSDIHPSDPRSLRDALGCLATGVTVITTIASKGQPVGITANSFSAVSLQPPLVLFSLNRGAYSLRSFLSAHHFAVNILRADQRELASNFAVPLQDKWKGIHYEVWETGCPILRHALASFECKIRYTYNGGDHVIFVGEVLRMTADLEGRPLLFYRGRYSSLDAER